MDDLAPSLAFQLMWGSYCAGWTVLRKLMAIALALLKLMG
jgi:hypothetical protein